MDSTKKRVIIAVLVMLVIIGIVSRNRTRQEDSNAISVTTIKTAAYALNIKELSVGTLSSLTSPVVKAETTGRVNKLWAEVGQEVKAGQVLAEIDRTDQRYAASTNVARVSQLKAQRENLQRTVERFRALAKSHYVSQAELDKAETSLRDMDAQIQGAIAQSGQTTYELARTHIVSPVNGKIQARYVSTGDFVATGSPVFQVVSLNPLRANLPFPETLVQVLHIGQPVRLITPANPSQSVSATLTQINPVIDAASRSIQTTVDFLNHYQWQPGQSVEAEVTVLHKPSVVMVPLEAIVNRPAGSVVYVVREGKAFERKVVTGTIKSGWIEILKGLAPHENIVRFGAPYLNEGVPVKVNP